MLPVTIVTKYPVVALTPSLSLSLSLSLHICMLVSLPLHPFGLTFTTLYLWAHHNLKTVLRIFISNFDLLRHG